jgi:hypothetical protein
MKTIKQCGAFGCTKTQPEIKRMNVSWPKVEEKGIATQILSTLTMGSRKSLAFCILKQGKGHPEAIVLY